MKWVTRERPKIDRIACPWLITRFIDPQAEFLYVPAGEVLTAAAEQGAIPYDIPNVELSHRGELCSFDAFLAKYDLTDPALKQLAVIVRGADTNRLDLAPQAAGLAGRLPRSVPQLRRRPRHVGPGHGPLRCPLRLVPVLPGRDPRLATRRVTGRSA